MRIKLLMFVASTIMACGCASASSKEVLQTTQSAEFSEKCGITLALPADLFSMGQGTLGTCVGSYDTVGGTVLSLAPIDSSLHDPSWMDRIPTLHIRRASINAVIQKDEEAIFHGSPTRKTVIAASASMECNLKAKTTVEKIYGKNRHGWLAEDIYKTKKNMHPPRAYYSCESFWLVAGTVNVGSAATSFSYINGLQARFQADTKALVELADVVQFPDAHDTLKLIPDW